MTFGLSKYDSGDAMVEYLNSANTGGIAAALSGSFAASPSFDISAAEDSAAFAKARNVDAGSLTYAQALNVAPKGGAMITKAQALAGLEATPVNLALLAVAAYIGHRNVRYGVVLGPLAALGLMKLFDK